LESLAAAGIDHGVARSGWLYRDASDRIDAGNACEQVGAAMAQKRKQRRRISQNATQPIRGLMSLANKRMHRQVASSLARA